MSPGRLARKRALVAVCMLAPFLVAVRASAQPALRVPNATLLRRLGEACDGLRGGGGPIYLIADFAPPNVVFGAERDSSGAEVFRGRLGIPTAGLFPCLPTIDPAPLPPGGHVTVGCVHDGRSAMDPPSPAGPPRMCPPELFFRLEDVESVSLVVRLRSGERVIPIREGADAIFLNLSAIDKFVIPYYVRILGVDAAAAMRREFVSNLSRMP